MGKIKLLENKYLILFKIRLIWGDILVIIPNIESVFPNYPNWRDKGLDLGIFSDENETCKYLMAWVSNDFMTIKSILYNIFLKGEFSLERFIGNRFNQVRDLLILTKRELTDLTKSDFIIKTEEVDNILNYFPNSFFINNTPIEKWFNLEEYFLNENYEDEFLYSITISFLTFPKEKKIDVLNEMVEAICRYAESGKRTFTKSIFYLMILHFLKAVSLGANNYFRRMDINSGLITTINELSFQVEEMLNQEIEAWISLYKEIFIDETLPTRGQLVHAEKDSILNWIEKLKETSFSELVPILKYDENLNY
jgi:hypothetical protein